VTWPIFDLSTSFTCDNKYASVSSNVTQASASLSDNVTALCKRPVDPVDVDAYEYVDV
jgi:hypothetical protein